MTPDTLLLSHRLDVIETKLDAVLAAIDERETNEWLTSTQMRAAMSISDRQLTRLIQAGVISGNAIRNVGSIKSPRYRFHKSRTLNQWLSRASTHTQT